VLEDRKICFELEGGNHFYRDGDFLWSGSIFKKHILQNFGWKVITITHVEWKNLSSSEKIDLIRNKMSN
jgi:hypothetical protein